MPKHVIVIGAGIAGLRTALELSKQNYRVTLLEARDRVGGRIYTEYASNGFPLPMGAAYIHGPGAASTENMPQGENPILPLARQYHLNYQVVDEDSVCVLNKDKAPVPLMLGMGVTLLGIKKKYKIVQERVSKQLENLLFSSLMKTDSNDAYGNVPFPSFSEVFESVKDIIATFSEEEQFWIKKFILADYLFKTGMDNEDYSIINVLDGSYKGGDAYVTNTYQPLVDGLLKEVGDTDLIKIVKEAVATKVKHSSVSPCEVSILGNDQPLQADAVVCTVPLGVLKQNKIQFEPALSIAKTAAIQHAEMAVQNKIIIEFEKPFWDSVSKSFYKGRAHFICPYDSDPNSFMIAVNLYALSNQETPTLIFSFLGKDSKQSKEVLQKKVLDLLYTNFKKEDIKIKKIVATNWHEDEFAYGSWSVSGLESTRNDRKALADKEGQNLFFAGEHTGNELISTVHAAYHSAERVTKELCLYLKEVQQNTSTDTTASTVATEGDLKSSAESNQSQVGNKLIFSSSATTSPSSQPQNSVGIENPGSDNPGTDTPESNKKGNKPGNSQ